jgi:hypothetical protein
MREHPEHSGFNFFKYIRCLNTCLKALKVDIHLDTAVNDSRLLMSNTKTTHDVPDHLELKYYVKILQITVFLSTCVVPCSR